MPKVSIIVPCYGVEKYLDRCVESLVNQTLNDIEIILVDDKSPDRVPQMCDEWVKKDSRIRVVHKPVNEGLGMACNTGLDVATGCYVAFCDSDDWVDKNMYETMFDEAEKHESDAVYTGLKRVNGNGRILNYMQHPAVSKIYNGNEVASLLYDMICAEPHQRYDHGIQVSAKVVLYRRKHLLDNDLRFVSERQYPSEDLIFNASVLATASSVRVLHASFYNYFVNDVSITSTLKVGQYDRILKSMDLIRSVIDKQSNSSINKSEAEIRLNRFTIAEARTHARQIIASTLTVPEKKELLRNLSKNKYLRQAVSNYPLRKMPLVQLIILELILGCQFNILRFLFRKL